MKPTTPNEGSAIRQTLDWLRALPRLRVFPLRDAFRTADSVSLKSDFTAGLTVALLAFPMALAFATKAGLPVWCGILTSGIAAIVAPMLAGSPLLSCGPTNASAALLVGAFTAMGASQPEMRVALLPALLLMTGLFLLLTSWLRLGGFADFIPRTVIAAYIAAAAIRITAMQLPVALGVSVDATATPIEVFWRIATAGRDLLNSNMLVAIATLCVFILVRRTKDTGPAILAAIATASFFAMIAENVSLSQGHAPRQGLFTYVGDGARWTADLSPDFSFRTFSILFSPALALAVLIVIESTANARASALKTGKPADIHQEILGIGVANLACGACSGMPASGSVSRSAINITAGARSGFASIFTGILILGIGFAASGIVAKIPLASLAILVIAAERELANLPVVRLILRSSTQDRVTFLVTLVTALIAPLDIAIFLGTAVAIAFYLRQTASPQVVEYTFSENGEVRRREANLPSSSICILHVAGSLHFGATQAFHEHLRRASSDSNLRVLVLKFREAEHLDANGVLLLRDVAEILRKAGRHLILCEVTPETRRVLEGAGLIESIGLENVLSDDPTNPTLSLAEAVRRARKLSGENDAVLKILTSPHPDLPPSAASRHEDWQI